MSREPRQIYIGDTLQKKPDVPVRGEYVTLLGESFYRIHNYDAIEPFFISVVSSSDHWLFVSSTGGLSAGRATAENALFPYYTVDKLTENSENTGNKAILLVTQSGRTSLWEPFSDQHKGSYSIQRNLYKNVSGTALVFEEVNATLGLSYQYAWRTCEQFGFVKTSWLKNVGDTRCHVEFLDGIQNILPANVASATQNTFSALLDAYKRSELHAETGLAVFGLSSTLTDLAEPSESLLATTVAQVGLSASSYLLSSVQLDCFRSGGAIIPETDVRGRRGAYFVHTQLDLAPGEMRTWHLLADVRQDSTAVARMIRWLEGEPLTLAKEVERDISANQASMWRIVASADGVQLSNNPLGAAHHFANVMFNVMRGGIFADQYWVQAADFLDFVSVRNPTVLQANSDFFAMLPDKILISDLQLRAEAHGSADLIRLSYTYLPLTFSRRHGDPSRPWNRFAINVRKPDGSVRLDYEGNWRDIFQNWEALAYSYPEYVESMIATFLNATTADGYNPYRITYYGIDWEVPEPGNPWANIGYWSDHQIIYLQRLMEISTRMHPDKLQGLLTRPLFSYANIPYRIKPYADLLKDPYNTIDFDWSLEQQIEAQQHERGTDGKFVYTPSGQILQVSLAEKLLTLLLAKLVNFVPDGGVWMNTQRPEWNDANNALVGKGLSVVTLCYLRRYVVFCRELFFRSGSDSVPLQVEIHRLYDRVADILKHFRANLQSAFNDEQRRNIMDALGEAGSEYRWNFYRSGFSGEIAHIPVNTVVAFLDLALEYIEQTLRANKRADSLYHSYNILHLDEGRASVSHLYEMLEGQVAILSSGLLTSDESLALLENLQNSALYLPDRHSYILYPDRNLPGFLEKNCLTADQVAPVVLLGMLVEARDESLITRDVNGVYHFAGHIRNFHDVSQTLDALKQNPRYAQQVEADFEKIRALFEATFRHDEFTGRSGTFFAYEGLGSIYWHMVAKLLLAAQETAISFRDDANADALLQHYWTIRQGLGFNKTPDAYGAFPTDPYSHTPKGQGAKQPGMTGMVKEEILTRQAELGYHVEDGIITFDTAWLDRAELLSAPSTFSYLDVQGRTCQIDLQAGALAYSICQTPIILQRSGRAGISVHYADGSVHAIDGHRLDSLTSSRIFRRDGSVARVVVSTTRDPA